MTKSAAMALGREGVRVNAVCPAPIDTQMADQLTGTDDPEQIARRKERFAENNLVGRIGEPEDVAALVAFLCSDDASFITGGIYTVDGGSRAR
jgi:NAD(P)-dependent dehydrogenase (short-subunit alcohol dehydrogenase family)